jgi:hypothetical protein
MRGRKQAWTGTIVDKLAKNVKDSDRGGTQTFYTIVIKLDSGKQAKIAVNSTRYKEWKVGDRLEKKSGQNWPEKIK